VFEIIPFPLEMWYLPSTMKLPVRSTLDDDDISSVSFCNNYLCAISYTLMVFKSKKGTTASYSVTNLATNNKLYNEDTKSYEPTTGLILLYNSKPVGIGQIYIPPTVTVQSFVQKSKYSTSDTAIDSFAISGLVVSSILVFITTTKLLLWFFFSPSR